MIKLINFKYVFFPLKKLSSKNRRIVLFVLGTLICALIPLVAFTFLSMQKAEAAWFDTGWNFRKSINISDHVSNEYNVYINLTGSNDLDTSDTTKFQADCGDLRFTDSDGNLLPYYIVSGCGTAATVVHVFFENFPVGAQDIYYYYGNPSAQNGFSSTDFTTEASSYTFGTVGSEEAGPGPISWWKFNDASGTTAKDSSSRQNNGTLSGAGLPTWQTESSCLSNGCLLFNGSSSYVSTGNLSGVKSVSFWVKPTSTTQSFIQLATGISVSATSGTVNATGFTTPTIYVNGKVNGTITANEWNFIMVTTASGITANSITLGRISTSYLNGYLDEIRIYDYEKSSTQMTADYAARGGNSSGLVFGASSAAANLSSKIVGQWKLDEGYGTTANNSKPTILAGTLTSMSSPAESTSGWSNDGKYKKAISFDGTNDYVVFSGNPSGLQITSNLTISAWIKLRNTSSVHDIVAKKGASGQYGYRLFTDANGKINLEVSSNGTAVTAVTGLTTLSSNKWYHVAGVYSPSTSLTVYVDGVQDGQNTTSIPASIFNSSSNVNFGAENAGATNRYAGMIDEVKIYNATLTSSEVKLDMNLGGSLVLGAFSDNSGVASNSASATYCVPGDTATCAPPVAEWNFEEGQGTMAYDVSGNGTNGTITGAPYTQGKFGKALSFDGSSGNTVNMGNPSSLNFGTGSFTYSLWVYVDQSAGTYDMPIYKGGAGPSNAGFDMELGTGPWTANISDGTTNLQVPFSTGELLNRWVYLTVVIDRNANDMLTYVNGTYYDGLGITGLGSVSNGSQALQLSRSDNFYYKGKIDGVRIYNYARTPAQIAWDYNSGKAVAHFKMDECKGLNVRDSINNSTGTIYGLGTTVAYDSFGGSGALTSHTADVGGTWSILTLRLGSGNGFDADLASGQLRFSHHSPTSGLERRFFQLGSGTDGDVDMYLTDYGGYIDEDGVGQYGDVYKAGVFARYGISPSVGFYALITDGTTISLLKYDGSLTAITTGSVSNPGADQPIRMRFQVSGSSPTTLKAKAWRASDSEPGTWAINTTDNTANLQRASGNFGVTSETYSDSAQTNTTFVDDFYVGRSGGGGQPAPGTCNISSTAWGNGATGKFNASLSFDGTDDYIVTNNTGPSLGDKFTISLWIKRTRTGIAEYVLDKGVYGANHSWGVLINSSNNISLVDGFNDTAVVSTTSTITDTNWHHVVFTKNGSTSHAYLDGKLNEIAGTDYTFADQSTNLHIANESDNSTNFSGQLDDIQMFNYPLTASQIKLLYNGNSALRFGPSSGRP